MTIIPLLPMHEPSPEAVAYADNREKPRASPSLPIKAGELSDHVSDYLKEIRTVLDMKKQPQTARDVLDYLASLSPHDRRLAHHRLSAHFPQIKDFTRKTWMLDLIFPTTGATRPNTQRGGDGDTEGAQCQTKLAEITAIAEQLRKDLGLDPLPTPAAEVEPQEDAFKATPDTTDEPSSPSPVPNQIANVNPEPSLIPSSMPSPSPSSLQAAPQPTTVEMPTQITEEPTSLALAAPVAPVTSSPVATLASIAQSKLDSLKDGSVDPKSLLPKVLSSVSSGKSGPPNALIQSLIGKLKQDGGGAGDANANEVLEQLKSLQQGAKELSPEKKKIAAEATEKILAAAKSEGTGTVLGIPIGASTPAEPLPPLKNIFAAIVGMLSSFRDSLAGTPLKVLIPSGIALVFVLVPAILSVSYLASLVTEFQETILLKNPVNRQSLDYLVSRSNDSLIGLKSWKDFVGAFLALFNGQGSKYKYMLFLVFPVIVVLAASAGLWFARTSPDAVPGFVVAALAVCLVQGIIAFVLNYVIFFYGNFVLRLVSKRIRSYNTYVYRRIYKDPEFLKSLTELQSSTFEAVGAIKETMRKVPQNISANDLAKVMFSVNMYMHYQKIGLRNPNIVDALKTFTPYYLLSPTAYSASDFLFRKRTYIDDYSEVMTTLMNTLESEEEWQKPPTSVIYEANVILTEWIASANNKANSLYAEDALVPFLKMAILMALVQWLPIILIVWIFRKPETRQALAEFLSSYFAQSK